MPTSLEAVQDVSKNFGNRYSITHVLWMLFGTFGVAGIAALLTLELRHTRVRLASALLCRLLSLTQSEDSRPGLATSDDADGPGRAKPSEDRSHLHRPPQLLLPRSVRVTSGPCFVRRPLIADTSHRPLHSISTISFILFLTENKACVSFRYL